jgi:hypothetical protein
MLPSHVTEVDHWLVGFSLVLLGTGGTQGAPVLERRAGGVEEEKIGPFASGWPLLTGGDL